MAKYRILEKDGKYKVQIKGWFFWADFGCRYSYPEHFETKYFDTKEEAEDTVREYLGKKSKEKKKWSPIDQHSEG